MSPARRAGAAAPALRAKLVLAFYVFAAALLPLAHHDVVCHLKSSTHCTTCVVGSSSESAAEHAAFAPFSLHDTGAASRTGAQHVESASSSVRSGRAPPAIA